MPYDNRRVTLDEVLAVIERERVLWEGLLAEVGEERMLIPGPMGEWTFRDLIVHLTGWSQRSLDRLEAAASGQPLPPPPWPAEFQDDDPINAWIQEHGVGLSVSEAIAVSRRNFERLTAVVQSASDDYLNDPASLPWVEGYALGPAVVSGEWFAHLHEDHLADIRAWLATLPASAQG